jgi:hypothetical protein
MTPTGNIHPRLELPIALTEAIASTSASMVADGFKTVRKTRRKRAGETLRPGADTPLWNAIVAQVRPLLKAHGEQARLARVIGVPRQTVHAWFVSGVRLPDAERTLLILAWLAAKREGQTPA